MQQITLSNIFRPQSFTINSPASSKPTTVAKVKAWLNAQEPNRLMWLGISLLVGIGTVLPITLLSVVFWANNNMALWSLALAVNVPVLIINLAAQPPKITLPLLSAAWVFDAGLIAYCAVSYFV